MNRYPLHPRPQRWEARLSPTVIRLFRSLRRRKAANEQRLDGVDVRGAEIVRAAIDRGCGVLITPNHPGHADAYAMFEAADAAGSPFYFMSAWQVFELQGAIGRWLLTRHGCFSVDREGADKEAFRTAVEIVRERAEPLVVFPEGEVYHQNDRVTPFRDGAAAIALTAAKKAERPIVAVPCAIRYAYVDDPTPALVELMGRLEEKVLWRRRPELPLPLRVYRFAEALLALKEIEYLGETQSGTIAHRRLVLADHILSGIEERYGVRERAEKGAPTPAPPAHTSTSLSAGGRGRESGAGAIPVRVKEARAACLKRLGELEERAEHDDEVRHHHGPPPQSRGREGDHEAARVACDLDDLFLVVQAFSYPGDYVDEKPSVERLAETLDKFEEDVLGAATATVRARRRAVVAFGEAVEVGGALRGSGKQVKGGAGEEGLDGAPTPSPPPHSSALPGTGSRGRESQGRLSAGELTAILERRVQELLDGIE